MKILQLTPGAEVQALPPELRLVAAGHGARAEGGAAGEGPQGRAHPLKTGRTRR